MLLTIDDVMMFEVVSDGVGDVQEVGQQVALTAELYVLYGLDGDTHALSSAARPVHNHTHYIQPTLATHCVLRTKHTYKFRKLGGIISMTNLRRQKNVYKKH